MKIPRYVKVKPGYFVEEDQVGLIYDTNKPFPNYLTHCKDYNWEEVLKDDALNKHFEPVNPTNLIINDYQIY